jgi:tetratricopeptide (TPR) repeat protein
VPAPPTDLAFLRALAANRSGDKDGARQQLEAILEQDPEHADSLEVLAMLVSEQGELDRAIELSKRLLAQKPDSIMGHANISRFYMLKGDKETAEEWQSKARVLGWKDEIARKGAATGGAGGLSRGPDPETVTRQEQTVTDNPDDVLARLALARSYVKLDMHAKAIPHLRHALTRDETMSVLFMELGKALEAIGADDAAIELYARGIPVADTKGDFMPRNQMQTRLAALQKKARGRADA